MLTNYQRESERENWNLPFSRVFDMSLINRWRKNEEALPEWITSVLNQQKRKQKQSKPNWSLTLFRVWVCPIRMRALEEMMDRQKLIRMTERSERIYLQQEKRRREIHPVTTCIKLLLKNINQVQVASGQALQKAEVAYFLQILCVQQKRTSGKGRGRAWAEGSAHTSLHPPPSMLKLWARVNKLRASLVPSLSHFSNSRALQVVFSSAYLKVGLKRSLKENIQAAHGKIPKLEEPQTCWQWKQVTNTCTFTTQLLWFSIPLHLT